MKKLEPPATLHCNICRCDKPLDAMTKSAKCSFGRRRTCKECDWLYRKLDRSWRAVREMLKTQTRP